MTPTILVDTREKPHAITRILGYFNANRIEHVPQKLDIGDYQRIDNPRVVVDRKQSLSELATNLGTDKRRFMNEIRNAHLQGIKLYILCEHGGPIHSIEDVKLWRNPHGLITGSALADRMARVHISYGVEFLFCDKRSTGRRIAEILGVNP